MTQVKMARILALATLAATAAPFALAGGPTKGVSTTPANRIGTYPAPGAVHGDDMVGLLPDHDLTPGVVDETVTVQDICKGGTEHDLTAKQIESAEQPYFDKYKTFKDRIMTDNANGCTPEEQKNKKWEGDHLISLQMGGADYPGNLWPQPFESTTAGATDKDKIEDATKHELCAMSDPKAAAKFLQRIQKVVSQGFTFKNGAFTSPKYSWYTMFYEAVHPHYTVKTSEKATVNGKSIQRTSYTVKESDISLEKYFEAHAAEIDALPAPKNCSAIPACVAMRTAQDKGGK
jgi:hypothetical protein